VTPAWSDVPNKHHDDDNILDAGLSAIPYNAAYEAQIFRAVRW
jgi:hypothetical protein